MGNYEIQRCWENLANAIIEQAINDWTAAKIAHRSNPDSYEINHRIREVERFIRSQYFHTLTDVKPEVLLKAMRERLDRIIARRDSKHGQVYKLAIELAKKQLEE